MLKRVLFWVSVILIVSGQALAVFADDSARENTESAQASESTLLSSQTRAKQGIQAADTAVQTMVISSPTLPFVPPILPSFYNDPQFADREYGGRSLSYVFAVCGDGVYDPGEQCDDGNREAEDGCSDLCQLEDLLSCGDGKQGPGETCDDGNVMDGDGCSATCQSEGACGDGNLDAGEQCDDGGASSGDGCSNKCLLENPPENDRKLNEETRDKKIDLVDKIENIQLNDKKETKVIDTNLPNKDQEDQIEKDGVKSTVRYVQGRGITSQPGCLATCTMAKVYTNNTLEREYEILSERKITGGTYATAFGEVNCATGSVVSLSESALDGADDGAIHGTEAQVVGCTA